MYISPIAGDTSSFGWLCWLMLIDSIIYFIIGAYIRMVFPGMIRMFDITYITYWYYLYIIIIIITYY